MEPSFYFDNLYPLQDHVLRIISALETGFYLTGGTALSRVYLHHRFSDDLDLFVNDDGRFAVWVNEIIQALQTKMGHGLKVLRNEERFTRLILTSNNLTLRLEFVNDVPAHVGEIVSHSVLGRVDSAENILANKVTAVVDRDEPKDLADIWGLCCKLSLPLKPAIDDAGSKAAGIFPADLARVLCTATKEDWLVVQWIDPPPVDQFIDELRCLGESLIL